MTLLSEVERMRKQFDNQDAKVIKRLVDLYGQGYERIIPELDALREFIEAQLQTGKLTVKTLQSSAVYKNLIREVERELTAYQAILRGEITTAAEQAARAGLASGRLLTRQALADALGVTVAELPADIVKLAGNDALAFLAQYLKKDGVLFGKIDALSKYHAAEISQGIVAQVGIGLGPRDIAKWITDAYGMGLTDALRMARTTQLYSYRNSQLEVMKQNSDVLQGWVWIAELDDRTCPVCVYMNGSVHAVDETMESHFNCRCAVGPWVNGADSPVSQTGEEWLNSQSEAMQRDILGAKYEGWNKGDFQLSGVVGNYHSDVYGNMLVEKPLKDLVK